MDIETRVISRTAVEEVRKLVPGLSVAEASRRVGKKHGMKSETLRKDYYRHKNHTGDSGGEDHRFLLSAEQENILLGWILAQDASGLHVSKLDVIHFVRDFKKLRHGWDGWDWWSRFFEAHKTVLASRTMKKSRSNPATSTLLIDVKRFISRYRKLLSEHKLGNPWVINADETSLLIDQNSKEVVVLAHQHTQRTRTHVPQKGGVVSFIPFITANGEVLTTMYIIKGEPRKKLPPDCLVFDAPQRRKAKEPRRSWERYVATNESGWMTGELWLKALKKLVEVMKSRRGDSSAILIVDNFKAHLNMEAVQYAYQNNVHLLFLPPNATHLIQPLDQLAFARFKAILRQAYHEHRQRHIVELEQSS